uniref:Uncharacterized protein n=1 Tax=Neolamprologus brichardi TaxID=32507 RepID=A0A3Q4N8L0_NEOBR
IGYTVHKIQICMLLHSDRDPIPDVPAIYFVMPTEENIDRICQVIAHSNSLSWTQFTEQV